MRRCWALVLSVCVATVWAGASAIPAAGAVVPAAGSWGRAIEVPGLAALNTGRDAVVNSVSCASAGNCVAGGDFRRRSGDPGFVADERHGVWGKAIEVPGLRALGGNADVSAVSCASAGNCAAGGTYAARQNGFYQGYVADERNGVWGNAIEVPGLAALNKGANAWVNTVSCPSAGNCAADGGYYDSDGHAQVFVADERKGVWATAIELPGLGVLNKGGDAAAGSVTCASPGNCATGGYYRDSHGHGQGFVADERDGVWAKAIEVPGLAALNTRGYADVNSVSCASAGNCTAGGLYYVGTGKAQGFVASERGGVWGTAIEVPGLAALNTSENAFVEEVSCASPGNCAAGGGYASHGQQGFVAVERAGRWAKAIGVPGLRALNAGKSAAVFAVSCAPDGFCAAGGGYSDSHNRPQGFVVSQAG